MVVANEPRIALEDIKEVLKDEPEDFLAICTKVVPRMFHIFIFSITYLVIRPSVCSWLVILRRA